MMDLARFPWPDDAPPPGACVRLERPEPSLAVLVLDPPHRKLAVLDLPLMRDLALALDELAGDGDLSGVVLTGREPTSFAAGADVDALGEITDRELARELARYGQGVFQRIARLGARTVAAAGGAVPGGACELALWCDRIVLAEHPSTRIGLPETKLGILPAWGGCQLLPRRIGVPRALEAVLSGKLYGAREALAMGLADRLAPPESLLAAAGAIALGREQAKGRRRGALAWLVDKNPLTLHVIEKKARAQVRARTGGHYPAPPLALELVVHAPRTPLEEGLEREAEALGRLAVSPECKSLVFLFQASEEAKKLPRQLAGADVPAPERAGVIGAGTMGAAIAGLMAEKGIDVRLSDLSREALDAALREHRRRVEKARARGRLGEPEAAAILDRLQVTERLDGFRRAQIVIEAVAERMEVKRSVFASLAREVPSGALLATNTSSLSVAAIAEGLPHPERVVGMHFFNPVHRMPLVEVVRGRGTGEASLAATAKLALHLGKTPVVVRDVPGFLVNRLLGPYLDEAVRILCAGVEPERIERAAREFGLPMGPLELLDEVGLDIAGHAARSLFEGYGERMQPSPLVERMLAAGLQGKKSKAGFHLYEDDEKTGRRRKAGFNPAVRGLLAESAGPPAEISEQGIVDQLVLSMVCEAARALEEEVVSGPRPLDLATVFGMGFPPFRGGLLRYADARGIRDVVATLRRIAAAPDVLRRKGAAGRFQPPRSLLEMAERDRRFHQPA